MSRKALEMLLWMPSDIIKYFEIVLCLNDNYTYCKNFSSSYLQGDFDGFSLKTKHLLYIWLIYDVLLAWTKP